MMKGEQSKPVIEISSTNPDEEEDRISSLLECLVIQIKSRFPYKEYIIRTGTHSKQWQHFWPQIHDFIISLQPNNLNSCIPDAITHNVQEFDVYIIYFPCDYCDEGFVLPEFSFSTSSFIHLTLSQCKFKQANVVSWENLKTLRIEDAELDHDSIKNIFSGTPLLETLVLYRCYGFELLDITNKSVKNLVISGYVAKGIYSVEINAPYILSLTIQDGLPLEKLLLLNVSSVIEAELDYYKAVFDGSLKMDEEELNEEMLKGLLLSLGHVKEVIIRELCLKALAGLKAKGFTFPSNLKVLRD